MRRGKVGGRKRGGHNRGYWYRSGRGCYVTRGGKSVKLCDANGNHIKLPAAQEGAKTASAGCLLEETSRSSPPRGSVTVIEVCRACLDHVQKHAAPGTRRHTYAKRMLGGDWGQPVTLEVLAGLMGNSPKVCWDHYAQWVDAYDAPMWNAIDVKP